MAGVGPYLKGFLREPFSASKIPVKMRETGREIARKPPEARLAESFGDLAPAPRRPVALLQRGALDADVKVRTGCEELQRWIVRKTRLLK